jgi:hypothetical protein
MEKMVDDNFKQDILNQEKYSKNEEIELYTRNIKLGNVIDFDNIEFTKNIKFIGDQHDFYIKLKNGKFKNKISFEGHLTIKIEDSEFHSINNIDNLNGKISIDKCTITEVRDKENIYYKECKATKLFFEGGIINEGIKEIGQLIFEGGNFLNREVDVENVKELKFENITINSKSIAGSFIISNFNPSNESLLDIKNSDMEFMTFSNSDMSNSILKFEASDLTKITMVNSRLPKSAVNLEDKKNAREPYRQLKIVCIKHYDKIGELYYKAKEYNEHFKSLKWSRDFNSKFVLCLNKYSNCYSTQWWPALIWIFVIGLIFYPLYLLSLDLKPCNIECWNKSLLFLTPARSLNPLELKTELTFLSYLVDIFHRILSGFFIYQFIQAFRKYGK